jgi:tRNA (guanine37-N1)-methyltransferase
LKRRLRELLSEVLPPEDLACVYNSYDIIGDIAVVRLMPASEKYSRAIAEAVMAVHKNVKTVLAQKGPVHGDFRLRKLEWVAGQNKTTSVHKECGCAFSVDVAECYFSPRLMYERMRIARQVESGEVLVNMFAGVGCFSIIVAKHSDVLKAHSIDVNPVAFQFMRENIRKNGVYGKVIPLLGDAKQVIEERLTHVADRVLMPLPEKAFEYLPYALLALKKSGGWIHYYDFEYVNKNESPVERVRFKVAMRLQHLNVDLAVQSGRIVRTTGPNWHQVVLDIRVNSYGQKHFAHENVL